MALLSKPHTPRSCLPDSAIKDNQGDIFKVEETVGTDVSPGLTSNTMDVLAGRVTLDKEEKQYGGERDVESK